MSVADAVAAAVARLSAAGLSVAVRSGDLTPPCVYVQIGTVSDAGAVFHGGTSTTLWVYYVPVRGVENLDGDAAALDALFYALSPLATAEVIATRTSLTVSNDTWPAYRADCPTLSSPIAVPAAAATAKEM